MLMLDNIAQYNLNLRNIGILLRYVTSRLHLFVLYQRTNSAVLLASPAVSVEKQLGMLSF